MRLRFRGWWPCFRGWGLALGLRHWDLGFRHYCLGLQRMHHSDMVWGLRFGFQGLGTHWHLRTRDQGRGSLVTPVRIYSYLHTYLQPHFPQHAPVEVASITVFAVLRGIPTCTIFSAKPRTHVLTRTTSLEK